MLESHFIKVTGLYPATSRIHLNFWHHSHKKQKNGLESQLVFVDIFTRTWSIWRGRTENTSIQWKNGSFCEELLGENGFEAVLVDFCCYDFGANASETVQKISTGTLKLYANSLKQLVLQLQLWKNIFSSLLPAYWGQKPGFCFFLTQIKMSKQHMDLSLTHKINANH